MMMTMIMTMLMTMIMTMLLMIMIMMTITPCSGHSGGGGQLQRGGAGQRPLAHHRQHLHLLADREEG